MVGVAGKSKGCHTCRRRKVRCDLQRPSCQVCRDGHRVCLGYVKDLVFLPYKNPPAKTCSTDSASSREAKDKFRSPIAFSSSSLASCQSQRKAGLVISQSVKPSKTSRSRPRSNPESNAKLADDTGSGLTRLSPCKNWLLTSKSANCGFSFPDQEECDNDYETMLPSLNMLLRSGRQDPFRQYPIPSVGRYADELMDYGLTIHWSGVSVESSKQNPEFPKSVLVASMATAMNLHAALFTVLGHRKIISVLEGRKVRNHEDSLRLHHKLQAIRLVNIALSGLQDEYVDNTQLERILVAISALSSHEVERLFICPLSSRSSPFTPPLTDATWLSVYGALRQSEDHLKGLGALIMRLGGLEKLKAGGLAEVVSYCDIIHSTHLLIKPHFPLLERHRYSIHTFNLEGTQHCRGQLGDAFQSQPVASNLSPDLAECLEMMSTMTSLIDAYTNGFVSLSNIAYLTERRNMVQHALLSLPPYKNLERVACSSMKMDSPTSFAYEPLRLTALIYSVGVIFPMPPASETLDKLVVMLNTTLFEQQHKLWIYCPGTLLWMLVLGGIAAEHLNERLEFVLRLATLTAAMDINSWPDVVEVMERHLWMESACGLGGEKLWREVMELRICDLPVQCDSSRLVEKVGIDADLASRQRHEDDLSVLQSFL